MKDNNRQFAFTLIEMLVVVVILAIIVTIAMPAVSTMIKSNKMSSARNLIRSALGLAQAHAAKTQKYAGVRFQFDRDGWKTGTQYLVIIETDHDTTFNAVANMKPATLPTGIGVISLDADTNGMLDDDEGDLDGIMGATTFCIIFSPTGQLAKQSVEVYARDDADTTFGSETNVNDEPLPGDPKVPTLYHDKNWGDQDTRGPDWCRTEPSAMGLRIFEVEKMEECDPDDTRFDDYVYSLDPVLINHYTGTIIDEEW